MTNKFHPTGIFSIITFLGIVIILIGVAVFTGTPKITPAKTEPVATKVTPLPTPPPPKHLGTDKFYAPILMYHHISDTMKDGPYVVRPETFEKQMAWLKDNKYNVITYAQFYEALMSKTSLPEKPVVLTFDDNNKDQYYNALPVLKKYGYSGIFFIPTAYIERRGGVMTWDMLKDLVRNNMEIGAHSSTHPDLRVIPRSQLYDEELTGSKEALQKNLGIEIKFFAYPGGANSKSVVQAVKDTGYASAVTTFYTPDHTYDENPYKVSRIYVGNNMDEFTDFIVGKNLYKAH